MATSTVLVLKSQFFAFQGQHYDGAATGGSTGKITDSTFINLWSETYPFVSEGKQVRITSGSASGDLRQIVKVAGDEGDLYPNRAFSAAIANADGYELWGAGISGGLPLTRLFNDTLRELAPVSQTQKTIVTGQTIYDITTIVRDPRDVYEVYIRNLDTSGLRPYDPIPVSWWDTRWQGGGGTTSVILEIRPSLTLNTATTELWIEHTAQFTAFTADTETVDAVYRVWLPWECIRTYAQRKMMANTSDKGRWKETLDEATRQLIPLRNRFMPRSPVRVMPSRPVY